jgi:hypothetical protein
MRPIMTTLAAAALGLAAIIPAAAQGIELRGPGVSVGVGDNGYRDRYYDDESDREDIPRGGRSYYYDNDNNCRVEIVRERHWDGTMYVHRERHCD